MTEKENQTTRNYPEYIAVSKIGDFIKFISTGTIRQLIFFNRNGFKDKCVRRINNRLFICTADFFNWIEETNKASA